MRSVVWSHAAGPRLFTAARGAVIEVTSAEPELAAHLVRDLSAAGYRARQVEAPSGAADICFLTEGLATADPATRHWSALRSAREARRDQGVIILLQSAHVYSGLEGLSRTLRKEWPQTACYAWTIGNADTAPILRCLASGQGDGALTAASAAAASPGQPILCPAAQLEPGPHVWLVTGGARGVTAACAIELARLSGGVILLAGRSEVTPWPDDLAAMSDLKFLRSALAERSRIRGERTTPVTLDRTARALLAGAEIRVTLAAIEAAGASADYIQMDAGDAASVHVCLSAAQAAYGPITGWVHGAGVLADRLAADKTEGELRRVFAPKVDGLMNVLDAIDAARLTHVGFFSSAAAFFGNKGQSDYAMANALLASAGRALASANPELRVKVFHWGPWAGGMVDDALASHFAAQGIPLIPIDEGARIFACEMLAGDRAQVELIVGEAWASA